MNIQIIFLNILYEQKTLSVSVILYWFAYLQTFQLFSISTLSVTKLFVVFQSVNGVWLFVTLWTSAHQASLSFTIYQSWLKLTFMSIELVMLSNHLILKLSNHLILCCPLLLLPPIFLSIGVFPNEQNLNILLLLFV